MGDRKHRVRALIRVPSGSEDDEKALASVLTAWMGPWLDRKPSLLELILAAGFTRRPMPSREQIAESVSVIRTAQAKAVTDGDQALADQLDATARWVLALFEKGAEG